MSYSHCGKCRGLVADTDHACRICNRPVERTGDRSVDRAGERAGDRAIGAGAAVATQRVTSSPMSPTAPGRPGRRRPPHQLETFLRGGPESGRPPSSPAHVSAPSSATGVSGGGAPDPSGLSASLEPAGPSPALRATFLAAPTPASFAPAPVLPATTDATADATTDAATTVEVIDLRLEGSTAHPEPHRLAPPPPTPSVATPEPAATADRAAGAWSGPAWAVPTATIPRSRAIVVEGLGKTYGEGDLAVEAVRRVDLEVHEGEVVLIMGPSGSGKTTLLLMLGAMLRPTAGSVVIGGTPVSSVPERQLPKVRARHLGFIFQDFNLLSALTAQENVELACNLAGVRGRKAAARASALLDRVGLGHRLAFHPHQLSGGEKQRVAVARALANDPPLLLADEPTANLDSAHGKSIGQLLRRLADEDRRTSLIVTHDERLTEIADRVLWLEDGTITPANRGRS